MRIQLPFGDTAAPAPPTAPATIAEAPAPAAAGPDAGPPDAVRGGTRDAGDAPAAKLGGAKGEAEVTGDDDDFLPPVEVRSSAHESCQECCNRWWWWLALWCSDT
jgi:hypothetical protein